MTEDISFADGESQGGSYFNSEMSFRGILLNHLNRITLISSKEFHGGFWEDRVSSGGIVQKSYVPDTRKEYINSVNMLNDLLLPYFDDEMIEAEAKHNKAISLIPESEKLSINMRNASRKLFRDLSLFMKRKNYLELGNMED